MKITAIVVLKCGSSEENPIILANASDVSQFGFFQRSSVREFIVFVSRTVAKRTNPGQRQSVEHEGRFDSFLILGFLFCNSNFLISEVYILLLIYPILLCLIVIVLILYFSLTIIDNSVW